MVDLFPITVQDFVNEVDREVRQRKRVYPRMVQNGTLTLERANRQIATMEQLGVFLRNLPDEIRYAR